MNLNSRRTALSLKFRTLGFQEGSRRPDTLFHGVSSPNPVQPGIQQPGPRWVDRPLLGGPHRVKPPVTGSFTQHNALKAHPCCSQSHFSKKLYKVSRYPSRKGNWGPGAPSSRESLGHLCRTPGLQEVASDTLGLVTGPGSTWEPGGREGGRGAGQAVGARRTKRAGGRRRALPGNPSALISLRHAGWWLITERPVPRVRTPTTCVWTGGQERPVGMRLSPWKAHQRGALFTLQGGACRKGSGS